MTRLWHRSGRLQSRMREWKRRKKVLSLKKAISPLSTSKVPLTGKLLKAVKGKLIRWKSVQRALSRGLKTSLKGTKREMT